jgi:hypothetical protein
MTILEIVIIYLACGSPFAVGRLLRKEKYFGLQNVLSSIGSLFGWPLLVPDIARHILNRPAIDEDYSLDGHSPDSDLSEIRKSLEKEWFGAFGETDLIRFREELERYVNISLAISRAEQASSPEFELFDISSHADSEVGKTCLSRRNKQKLEVHQTASRTSFVEAVFRLDKAGNDLALDAAEELAELIGDQECVAELVSIRSDSSARSAMAA